MTVDYTGFYAQFEAPSKDYAPLLMGADVLVGDLFSIDVKTDDEGISHAWLVNKFDAPIGYLDVDDTRKIRLAQARGCDTVAILSFVAYSDTTDPGKYWGQAAILCYPAQETAFKTFADNVAALMVDGTRPDVSLTQQGIDAVVESGGTWMTSARIPLPKFERGTAYIKNKQSLTDKIVEQGRVNNPGCYVACIAFIVVVVLGILYFV